MIKIIESQKDFGSMSGGSIKWENLTEEDKKILKDKYNVEVLNKEEIDLSKEKANIFLRHRLNMGKSMGFDGRRIFMADQEHKKGTSFEITQDYIEANPNGWTDIPEDILIVTSKTPGVVIGHPVADCPVVMMTDRKQKISAIGHCSAEMIDRRLPSMIAEVLRSEYASRAEDIITYVSASIGDSWTYDSFPKWAKDAKIWDKCIYMGDDNLLHINLKPAILMQLIDAGLNGEKIVFNKDDTATNPNYYSNSMAKRKDNPQQEKDGRHFAGLFITNENDDIELQKGRVK